MSRREKEKAASLDKLAKLAYSSAPAAPPAPPKPAAKPAPPRPPARPARAPPSQAASATARAREKQLEERRAKLAEEKALRERRAKELARSSALEWRGMDRMGVPSSIRRTGFDRQEASVSQKIQDVLGEARKKESREKAHDKGKRSGGRA